MSNEFVDLDWVNLLGGACLLPMRFALGIYAYNAGYLSVERLSKMMGMPF